MLGPEMDLHNKNGSESVGHGTLWDTLCVFNNLAVPDLRCGTLWDSGTVGHGTVLTYANSGLRNSS